MAESVVDAGAEERFMLLLTDEEMQFLFRLVSTFGSYLSDPPGLKAVTQKVVYPMVIVDGLFPHDRSRPP